MAIRETEKGYYVEVFLGKDPLTKKKIRKTKLFTPVCRQSLKDAKAFEAEWLKMSENGEIDFKGRMYLREYLDYWFKNYVEAKVAYQTQKRYEVFCDCIKKGIGHIRLEKLSASIIQQFYTNLLSETIKRKDGTVVRRYANGTILKIHKMLHLALKWAVMWNMIHVNPADNVTPPSDDDREIKVWNLEEVNAFMDLLKEENKTLFPVAYLAYRTGMRESEISALKWENVDLQNSIIHVKHSMVEKKNNELTPKEKEILNLNGGRTNRKRQLIPEDVKTKKSNRDIALDDETTSWLKDLYDAQKSKEEADPTKSLKYEYVCCWEDGRPLRPQYITKSFRKAVAKHSDIFTEITFHGLRHTHASILYDAGISSNEISERLGHARTSITDDIYIHVKKERNKKVAQIFGEVLKNSKRSERTVLGQIE